MDGAHGEVHFSRSLTNLILIFTITGTTYRSLIRRLLIVGFQWHMYSDYWADHTFGAHAWISAIFLKLIDPPMKLETTIQGFKIHYYSHLHLLDVTDLVRIGGPLSRHLRGPIPASILPAGILEMITGVNGGAPVAPMPGIFRLPKHTRPTANSLNPNNYLT